MKALPSRITKLVGLLLSCLMLIIMLRWFEHSQVYHPDRILTATGAELGAHPCDRCFGRAPIVPPPVLGAAEYEAWIAYIHQPGS